MGQVKLGIDIDTWKLTLCAVGPEVPYSVIQFETAPIRRKGESLFDAIQGVAPALSLAVSRLPAISEVYIERGRGQHRKGEYELGAIYGAVAVAVRRSIPNAHIETMPLSDWKKAVTAAVGITTAKGVPGNGNAPKPMANAACVEILTGLGLLPPHGLTPDELDAFGIVYATDAEAQVVSDILGG